MTHSLNFFALLAYLAVS
ncbi:CRISPR-associated DxTHG motif protein [Treponema denticola]|nr:CRISPR-associated DxTHG motif protein [Treponema denticola]